MDTSDSSWELLNSSNGSRCKSTFCCCVNEHIDSIVPGNCEMTGVSVGTCCNWISMSTVHPTVHATIILIIFAVCYFSCPSLPAGCCEAATAGIKFTQKAKNQVFRPTHCTNSRQTWRGRRAPGSAWLCKILSQTAQGWQVGMQPQISKCPLFGSHPTGAKPLTDF